jgi:iron complex outermembrane receptor protein
MARPGHWSKQKDVMILINACRLSGPFGSLLKAVRAITGPCRKSPFMSFMALSLTLTAGVLQAQETGDLASLSVDDLMNVEVISVARKGQKLSDTAAAVFVITQDDIRRSGATSIPEVLRIVPGLDVARVNGNIWAISARGFNGRFANKLLVMIDGRSVYTPLFSGVNWDVQDTLLEDVDRIEVIRGPGGTLWGANAVNGIVNIIMKHAIETQGTLVSAGAGPADGSQAAMRYGGSIGRYGNYRVYGKSFDRPDSVAGASPSHDSWTFGRAGFRADWVSRRGDNFMAQGDMYRGTENTQSLFVDPASPFADRASMARVMGKDLQLRWTAIQSGRSDTTLQAFYYDTDRSQPTMVLGRRTFDIDFQQHLKLAGWSDGVWGAGYRRSDDRADGAGLKLVRDSNFTSIVSAFGQDEIQLARRFHVTIGTKIQYDPVSHLQLQPTLRLLFKASERQAVWAAATSAVRTPSEIELYGSLNVGAFPDRTGNAGLIIVTGNPELKPERVESYEVGYRWLVAPSVAFDATAFHNRMRDLVGTEANQPFLDSSRRMVIPMDIANRVNGHANGAEFLLTDSLARNWNVAFGYSFFQLSAVDDKGLTSSLEVGRTTTPRHQLQLRSFLQLPRQVELDWSAYYVGRIGSDVPAYLRLDSQLSWHPARQWALSISGQNLLRAKHTEFVDVSGEATPVQRTVNGKVTWRF